jgi:hypothetical protein
MGHLRTHAPQQECGRCLFPQSDRLQSGKVHLDVQFSRYRADGSLLGRYRSIWLITRIDRRWAAQLRSSFAS